MEDTCAAAAAEDMSSSLLNEDAEALELPRRSRACLFPKYWRSEAGKYVCIRTRRRSSTARELKDESVASYGQEAEVQRQIE